MDIPIDTQAKSHTGKNGHGENRETLREKVSLFKEQYKTTLKRPTVFKQI